MNLTTSHNLSTSDFVRMFEPEGKTELEQALFSRLVDYIGQDESVGTASEQFGDVFSTMEDAIADAENELDAILDNSPDDISDPVAKRLHDLAVQLAEVNQTQREIYDNIEEF